MLQKGALKNMDKKSLGRLIGYLKNYRLGMIIVVLSILVSAAAAVVSSLFIRILIDDYILPMVSGGTDLFSELLMAVGIICIIYLLGVSATLVTNMVMATVSQGTLKTIRDEMFSHMQRLPISYFDRNNFGDIMSHFTNDTDSLRQMLSQSLSSLMSSVMSMIMVMFSMLHLSLWLTLICVGFTFFAMLMLRTVVGKSAAYFKGQQDTIGDLNGYVEEMINGQKVIKVFSNERRSCEGFKLRNELLKKNTSRANALSMVVMPMMGNLGNLLYVIVALAGGFMALSGVSNLSIGGREAVTMGTIASFLILSKNFINPITQVSQQLNSVIMAIAGAGRIFAFLDEEEESDDGGVKLIYTEICDGCLKEADKCTGAWAWQAGEELIPLRGDIVLDGVDFSYIEGEKILHGVNVYARPGQKVAFVGATGAGKTTITNLINRFYDVEIGKITYDGIDIRDIKKYDLRKSLGIVLQDVNLFTGTVMENIRYGNPEATDEACINAAKLANADGFIAMLPNGYNTVLKGDGSSLSQGQRQLISIARAAVADPPVMILDEATSSIDTRTEAIVQKGMDNLMKGRTVFVIAHRLSTVKNADVIMVLEKGKIIERGSHDELIEKKGKYFQLYSGGFEDN